MFPRDPSFLQGPRWAPGRPSGVSQGDPREGPQSAILLHNGVILESILVPLLGPNLHTVLQKAPKWESKKLSKPALLGGCLGSLGACCFY